MSGYEDGEEQILKTLRLLSQYNTNNSDRVNWLLLNSGNSALYAIVKPGESTEEMMGLSHGVTHITYQTIIELWRLYQVAADALTLEADMETVKAHFRKYRFLGGGASSNTIDAQVKGNSAMMQKWLSEGGPRWAVIEIRLEWMEQQTITLAE